MFMVGFPFLFFGGGHIKMLAKGVSLKKRQVL